MLGMLCHQKAFHLWTVWFDSMLLVLDGAGTILGYLSRCYALEELQTNFC